MQIFFLFGLLVGYIGGSYIPMDINPWIMFTLPVIFLISFAFMPETPQQLLRRGHIEVNNL